MKILYNICDFFPEGRNFLIISAFFAMTTGSSQSQVAQLGVPQYTNGQWMIRYNQPQTREKFIISTSSQGLTLKTMLVGPEAEDLYVFFHLKLDKPIKGLTFDYELTGDAALMPITLFDAAANELWHFNGQGVSPGKVELRDLKVRGQVVFRIRRNRSVELPEGWSHSISNLELVTDNQKPVTDKDGFIVIDNINEFRGYASESNVKVRLKPGAYQINKALFRKFIEFTGNNSNYDMNGAKIMVDTKLFSQFGVALGGGEAMIYCVMGLSGNQITMEGPYIETYGNQPGIQSRNKIFNITGSCITLKNAEVRTEGSSPWGYGSLYGISGGDVRKMNGIRVGWPAKNVKLIGCKVHMRAMGHAIFVQGAENTLIEDCHVDGLLRTTDDILEETSGYAFDKKFVARGRGYIEGVVVGDDGKILPGEMLSLSEDGIRMYPQAGAGQLTGSTTIKNCTVTKMRRGICTGLSAAGDKVINCQVSNCVSAGFNIGGNDILINCRSDAKYAESLCLANVNSKNSKVELEISDCREKMGNNLLAKINGSDHNVTITTSDPEFLPDDLTIELSSTRGYGGPRGGAKASATNIKLKNKTTVPVVLLPGTVNAIIESIGKVENRIL